MKEINLGYGTLQIHDGVVDITVNDTRGPIRVQGIGRRWGNVSSARELIARAKCYNKPIIEIATKTSLTDKLKVRHINDWLLKFKDGIPTERFEPEEEDIEEEEEEIVKDVLDLMEHGDEEDEEPAPSGGTEIDMDNIDFDLEAEQIGTVSLVEPKVGLDIERHNRVDALIDQMCRPIPIHKKHGPEEEILKEIQEEGYVSHIIYEFMQQKQWLGFFTWIAKSKAMRYYSAIGTESHWTGSFKEVLAWNNDNIDLLRGQILEIIRSFTMTSAVHRPDRDDLMIAYITGRVQYRDPDSGFEVDRPFALFDEMPELKHLSVNNVNVKRKYDDRMGKSWYADRHGKIKSGFSHKEFSSMSHEMMKLAMQVLPKAKIEKGKTIGELVFKDGAEYGMAKGCMREELRSYDPEYREHKLEDLRLRLWQIIATDREHTGQIVMDHSECPEWKEEKEAAFGYGSVKDVLKAMKAVWNSKRPSFMNYMAFNKFTVINRLNTLWKTCAMDQVALSNPNLEDSVSVCSKCGYKQIPNEDVATCNKCGGPTDIYANRTMKYRVYGWESAEFTDDRDHYGSRANNLIPGKSRASHSNLGHTAKHTLVTAEPLPEMKKQRELNPMEKALQERKELEERLAAEAEEWAVQKGMKIVGRMLKQFLTDPFEEDKDKVTEKVWKRSR